MATTWADIQRLAADLQRVQLAEGTKRLSEANCVELVTMLMAMEKVHLVITTDGKEFVTRRHLVTECANECLASGGRIALTELAAQLSVDLDHIQTAVNQLLAMNRHHRMAEDENTVEDISTPAEFVVCAGELIHREFINDLCTRLNTRLTEFGQMSLFQLTKQWELPTELFNFHILPEIGSHPSARICAIRFEDILCTPRYINALRRKMSAVLVALTKPTSLSSIHSYFGISPTLFFKLWNEMVDEDKMPGHLLGSKGSLNSLYVPKVHEKMATQFIKQRISVDHFIECVVLKRLNVVPSDPLAFFREILPENEFADLLFWPSVVLSESKLCREFESLAQNFLQTNHFCLIDDILPPQFTFLTDGDYAQIIERLQKRGNGANLRATGDRSVVFEHPQLMDNWLKSLEEFVRKRAAKDAPELRKAHLDTLLGAKKTEKQQKDEWETDKPTGSKKGKSAGAKKGGGAAAGKRRGGGGTETESQPKNGKGSGDTQKHS
ncbi:hypothetical protein niasHS_007294 [Heterodera schachtii]|uniref:E3 UFM1-protein ligase 1 homolog n=1 Tax=Heterodera schachtii TaxID=97005 RepID=A0ABD2JJX0_HETSC